MTRAALLAALLLVACGGDPAEPGPDGGSTSWLEDGTYQVAWGEGEPRSWLDCDALELRDGALTLAWLGSDCREPALPGITERGCYAYAGAGYVWTLCPHLGVLSVDALSGQRREGGEVVATFEAVRR